MAGGAPAGIIKLPGDVGCQTKTTIMITIVIRNGNESTVSIETVTFDPGLSGTRFLKNDNLGLNLARLFSSVISEIKERDAVEGIRFIRP